MPKYIAKQSIGHFMPGDEIKGLEDKQLQALLASGAIEEEKALKINHSYKQLSLAFSSAFFYDKSR